MRQGLLARADAGGHPTVSCAGGYVVGATALLTLAAVDAAIGLGPAELQCGFPAELSGEPSIIMDIEPVASLYGAPGSVPVHLELSTGANDMRMAAVAQPLGPMDAPFVLIAGSPMVDIHFSLGVKGDGSASLTIRDTRRGQDNAAEVTRLGKCLHHENFFLMLEGV